MNMGYFTMIVDTAFFLSSLFCLIYFYRIYFSGPSRVLKLASVIYWGGGAFLEAENVVEGSGELDTANKKTDSTALTKKHALTLAHSFDFRNAHIPTTWNDFFLIHAHSP